MCLHRPEPRSAPGLPEGWTYVFTHASQDRTIGAFRGLRIVAKNGRTYCTAERALNGRTAPKPATLEKDVFYHHVGLAGVIDPKYPQIRADAQFPNGSYTTFSSLTHCGTCSNCTKSRCGTCFHCASSDPKAECLQKVRSLYPARCFCRVIIDQTFWISNHSHGFSLLPVVVCLWIRCACTVPNFAPRPAFLRAGRTCLLMRVKIGGSTRFGDCASWQRIAGRTIPWSEP